MFTTKRVFWRENCALFTFVTFVLFLSVLKWDWIENIHIHCKHEPNRNSIHPSYQKRIPNTRRELSQWIFSFKKFSHLLSYCRHCAPLWQPERANLLKSVWCEIKWRHSAFISFSSLPVWGAAAANFLRHTLSWHHRRILFPIITSSTNFLPHNFAD